MSLVFRCFLRFLVLTVFVGILASCGTGGGVSVVSEAQAPPRVAEPVNLKPVSEGLTVAEERLGRLGRSISSTRVGVASLEAKVAEGSQWTKELLAAVDEGQRKAVEEILEIMRGMQDDIEVAKSELDASESAVREAEDVLGSIKIDLREAEVRSAVLAKENRLNREAFQSKVREKKALEKATARKHFELLHAFRVKAYWCGVYFRIAAILGCLVGMYLLLRIMKAQSQVSMPWLNLVR